MADQLFGVKRKAQTDYLCQGCGGTIKKGTHYDYADGYSATYRNECGESERKYYQFRCHLPGECDEVAYIDEHSPSIDELFAKL